MRIVVARPPLFAEIDAAFGVAGKPVIFAFGDTIYNPTGGPIGAELQAHEAVHGQRQGCDIEGWWRLYISDPVFRLQEEIPAHEAEYRAYGDKSRNVRRQALHHIASRLASPLYGRLIRYEEARRVIKAAAPPY